MTFLVRLLFLRRPPLFPVASFPPRSSFLSFAPFTSFARRSSSLSRLEIVADFAPRSRRFLPPSLLPSGLPPPAFPPSRSRRRSSSWNLHLPCAKSRWIRYQSLRSSQKTIERFRRPFQVKMVARAVSFQHAPIRETTPHEIVDKIMEKGIGEIRAV